MIILESSLSFFVLQRAFSALKNLSISPIGSSITLEEIFVQQASPTSSIEPQDAERESMEFDVLVVGGGPAGLSTAIRLKQRAREAGEELSVCLLEKGATIGAHILSGAVFEPRALDELLPAWREASDLPLMTPARRDRFRFLTERYALPLPTPPAMHNKGNYIVSLGELCRWLAEKAEGLGVDIFPGFAAVAPHFDEDGALDGVLTGDMGIGKNLERTSNHQQGLLLRARQTVLAEGCRGSLGKTLIARFNLDENCQPQTYGIGFKELWEVPTRGRGSENASGDILHTIGWPLSRKTYGGSFLYHLKDELVSVGFVVGLDYDNPYLSPYEEFQRFKHHPSIAKILAGGRRIAYGARALNEGGAQSVPRVHFPGGLLVGCEAGFMNVPKIKGSHNAMKSGMLAADAIFDQRKDTGSKEIKAYGERLRKSWISKELHRVRNIRPAFRFGLWWGLLYAAFDTYILRGRAPWTFRHRSDHKHLLSRTRARPIVYPKPDGILSFDLLTNLSFSGVYHEENQPAHLLLKQPSLAISRGAEHYASPETRYCPAGVYEIVEEARGLRLQINAQNCLHCKTCDIKDPMQNIDWTPPEGGGGPNYERM